VALTWLLDPAGCLVMSQNHQSARRLQNGQQSHEVIALSATGHLGMAKRGQVQLTVVKQSRLI